jgi:bifunctional oligoribonuclease and PAP phosphatase NrnA
MASPLDVLRPLFHHHQSFVLSTHVNPDGDGLGSEIALAEWLIDRGKTVHIINHSTTPDFYRFLDPRQQIRVFDERSDTDILARTEVVVVLDTNSPDRLRSVGPLVQQSRAVKVCIDHHLDPSPFADHYVIDDAATSTGEILYTILTGLDDKPLSSAVASALYCAIMTDTGSFHYPRVDPETFRICAQLIEWGADPVRIYHDVYEQWSPGRMELLGSALASLGTLVEGKLAHMTISQENLRTTGTSEEDTDNFTVYPMSIKGVVAGIFLLELGNGVKISFRSKGDIPINELAKLFGGNGHKNAAGARLHNISLTETRERVLAAAATFLQHRP